MKWIMERFADSECHSCKQCILDVRDDGPVVMVKCRNRECRRRDKDEKLSRVLRDGEALPV